MKFCQHVVRKSPKLTVSSQQTFSVDSYNSPFQWLADFFVMLCVLYVVFTVLLQRLASGPMESGFRPRPPTA